MGISIGYRGRLPDLARVEDFEDRLLDFALEVGGLAQVWRSHADDCPRRVVRGLILHLAPGQEATSLLLSPEGWLVGLVDIEDAERGRLTEPPWCFVKTQFGPLEGHVALVEMLAAVRREFVSDLEVSDEGGYWETRDLAELVRKRSLLGEAMEGLAEGLQRHGLSREAAEDSNILLRRVERIAARVHRILRRPAEHPPVPLPDEGEVGDRPDPDAAEGLWDEMFKHNRRQQERLQRALEDRRSSGEDEESAFEGALRDLGLEAPEEDSLSSDEPGRDDVEEPFAQPINPKDNDSHPLLKRAMDLLVLLHRLFRNADARFAASLRTLFQGAGDMMGGLAQALSRPDDEAAPDAYGLLVTQLKRALRGAAFARGALFPLRPALTPELFDELCRTVGQMEQDIFQEMSRLRSEHGAGDS